MIFIPGLADQDFGPDQTVDGVAGRISNAFNIRATTAGAVFRTEVREQAYGLHDCYKARVATIFRRDGSKEEAVLDLYGMGYNRTLTGRFEKQNVLVKFLLTVWRFVTGMCLLSRSKGKTWRAKAQVLYAGSILLLLASYMVLLVIAAVDVGVSAVRPEQVTPAVAASTQASHPAPAWYEKCRAFVRGSIIIFAALGIVFPTNFKGHLNKAATVYL